MQLLDDLAALGIHQIYTGSGTGSGFLIDAQHLLTNAHVVAPYLEVAVEMRDKSRMLGSVRLVHPQRDLAIVRLEQPVSGKVLELGKSEALRAKQPVHILGFPVGLPLSLTEGVISHPNQLLDDQFFVQTDAAINPGNSGGPILNAAHEVIAVTTCKLTQADAVGFGIPIDDAHRFVEQFRADAGEFAVLCPACEHRITEHQRYCPKCGMDLDAQGDVREYFQPSDPAPLKGFVEAALASAGVNPVLARHGDHNWSFHRGSAPIKVWCCCPEHLNFSSSLAQTGASEFSALFRYLLDVSHEPFAFDIYGNIVRMSHVVHTSDVFADDTHAQLIERVQQFIQKTDEVDNLLMQQYGCKPAPETQVERLHT
jgi:serine protease Do